MVTLAIVVLLFFPLGGVPRYLLAAVYISIFVILFNKNDILVNMFSINNVDNILKISRKFT